MKKLALLLTALAATTFSTTNDELAASDGGSDSLTATVITSNPYVDTGSTVDKGNDALLASCLSLGSDDAEDAWYKLTVAGPIVLSLSTTCEGAGGPPSYDTRIAVLDESLNPIACNDDAPGCGVPYYQSELTDVALGAGTYFIVVDGYSGAEGPYELNASWYFGPGGCPSGSDQTNADPITSLPFTSPGTTVDACDNVRIDCELGPAGQAPDYWYTVSVDTMVLMDVSTTCDASSFDTRVAILDSSLTVIYCNDDDPACATSGKSLIEDAYLEAGQYYIVVEGPDATGDTYTINVDTTHTDQSGGLLLLPDIIVRESDLYDNELDTTSQPGNTLLRLSNGTANVGDGKLYLYGTGIDNGDGTENIMQRIWRSNGSTYDRTAGVFLFHPEHNHIHVEDWCEYSLREVLPGDGVGAVLAKSAKTSFCIVDLAIYDSGLPGFDPSPEFNSCGSTIQGLSIGWIDVYSRELAGQSIDVTGIPDGTYWLESTADPLGTVLEKDETNNVARIKVVLGSAGLINPDGYEPNDSTTAVDGRPAGGPNSPNLGPCNPQRVIPSLTVHVADNDDYFKFYSNETGSPSDFIEITFDAGQGDLDLYLADSAGTIVDSSATSSSTETISLDLRPEGWYYAVIRGANGDQSPDYQLTVDPPANAAPTVSVVDPKAGSDFILQGQDTYTVTWTSSDPDGDDTWARVYANTSPSLDGNEVLLSVSGYQEAGLGAFIINSAYLGIGTYWVYVEVTDGGTTTGDWSEGTIRVLDPATGIGDSAPPAAARLYAAAPNPFSTQTSLRLDLREGANIRWRIYDVRGSLVRSIESGQLPAGVHNRMWDGRDRFGRQVASGIYFQSVTGGGLHLRAKMVVLR